MVPKNQPPLGPPGLASGEWLGSFLVFWFLAKTLLPLSALENCCRDVCGRCAAIRRKGCAWVPAAGASPNGIGGPPNTSKRDGQ